MFGLVEKYVRHTHASTHSHYRLEVEEVFEVARQGEAENFKDVGNRYSNSSVPGGVVHAPGILCHISILATALEFCSTV